MRKQQIDYILTSMLESYDNVSDLNMTVDKPFQVESSGQLMSVPLTPSVDRLTPFQSEIFALNLIDGDRRLTRTLLEEGSCDSSYQLAGKARFRVNIAEKRLSTERSTPVAPTEPEKLGKSAVMRSVKVRATPRMRF